MAVITSTVGATGRNYATLALWKASLPANLVTDGNSYTASLYNDATFTAFEASNMGLDTSAFTTDSTHFLTIQAASGQGWNASSHATGWDQANGVAIQHTDHRSVLFQTSPYTVIDGLQLHSGNISVVGSSNTQVTNCLCETFNTNATLLFFANCRAYNNVVICRSSGGNAVNLIGSGSEIVYNTLVRPSDWTAAQTAIIDQYSARSATVQNNAFFGFTTPMDAAAPITASYNATDSASILGTNSLTSQTYASQFTTITDTGRDFRLALSGSSLVGAGAAYSGITTDVFGTTRGPSYDIGAVQTVASGTSYSVSVAETLTPADGANAARTMTGAIGETSAVTDATNAPLTTTGAIGETTAAADATSATRTELGAIGETTTASDGAGATLAGAATAGETTTATDAASAVLIAAARVTEAISVADAASSGASVYPVTVGETLSVADAASTGASVYPVTIAESVAILDAGAGGTASPVSIAETTTAADATGAQFAVAVSVAETITLADATLTAANQWTSTVLESIALAQASGVQAAIWYGSVIEQMTMGDAETAYINTPPAPRSLVQLRAERRGVVFPRETRTLTE